MELLCLSLVSTVKTVWTVKTEQSSQSALTTKDAFGKEIISEYDVRVKGSSDSEISIWEHNVNLPYNTVCNLDEEIREIANALPKVVDHYYTLAKEGDAEIYGLKLEGNTIFAPKECKTSVVFNYLLTNGRVGKATFPLTFKYIAQNYTLADLDYTVANEETTTETYDVTSLLANGNPFATKYYGIKCANIEYADGKYYYDGGLDKASSFELVGYDANNEVIPADRGFNMAKRLELKVTFDNTKISPKTHVVTLNIVNNEVGESQGNLENYVRGVIKFNINVNKVDDDMFKWIGKEAYFDGEKNAFTYKRLDTNFSTFENPIISLNLLELFELDGVNTDYIKFEENVPENRTPWISEPYSYPTYIIADASYESREFVANYYPFGNKELAVKHSFNLVIKSEIKDGTIKVMENSREIATKTNPYVISTVKNFTFTPANFELTDVFGVKLDKNSWMKDVRVDSYWFELSEEAQKYLTISASDFDNVAAIVVARRDLPGIQNPPVCEIKLVIRDKWGATTEKPFYVKIEK